MPKKLKSKKESVKKPKRKKAKKKTPKIDPNMRADWRENHAIIYQAFIDVLAERKKYKKNGKTRQYRLPAQTEISRRTGITRQAISRHLKQIDFQDVCNDTRIFLPDVVHNIGERALDNRWDAELYLALIQEYTKTEIHAFKGNVKIEQEEDLSIYTKAELESMRKIQAAALKRKAKNAA